MTAGQGTSVSKLMTMVPACLERMAAAAGGHRGVPAAGEIFARGLELGADGIDEADHSRRRSGRGEQAGLRPEGPLHPEARRDLGRAGEGRGGGAVLAGRRHAVGEADRRRSRRHAGDAGERAGDQWHAAQLRAAFRRSLPR